MEMSHISPIILTTVDDLKVKPFALDIRHASVVQGDLHGNMMKLLHFLVKSAVLEISDKDYRRLYTLYHQHPFTRLQLTEFIGLIDKKCSINPEAPYLRFMGDELCDRGNNDFFTLYLFKKISDEGVEFEVYQSNHSVDFSLAYEAYQRDLSTSLHPPVLLDAHARSLQGLSSCLPQIITPQELDDVVAAHKNHQRLIGFSLGKGGITIYSHAPVDLKIIGLLAKKLNVPYRDETAVVLAQTLTKLNLVYQYHIQGGTLHRLINNDAMSSAYRGLDISPYHYPLEYVFWNRDYRCLNRTAIHRNYGIKYVHGHDSQDPELTNEHIICLDSLFGKRNLEVCGKFIYGDGYSVDVQNPIYYLDEKAFTIEQLKELEVIEVVDALKALCADYKAHLLVRIDGASGIEQDIVREKIIVIKSVEQMLFEENTESVSNFYVNKIHRFSAEISRLKPLLEENTAPCKAFFRGIANLIAKIFGYNTDNPWLFFGSHGGRMAESSQKAIEEIRSHLLICSSP
jgi:hypothetical protein